jgi:spore coat protein U-like protein
MRYWLALPLFLAAASPAFAQSIDTGLRQVEIVGTANAACLMRSPNSTSGVNANFRAVSGTSGEIRITELVNPQTAQPRATSINITLPVICNSAHLLTVQSSNGGLLRGTGNQRNIPAGGGFSEFLPYSLNAAWAGQNVGQLSTNRAGLRIVTNNGGAGNVDIGFSVPASNTPLVAGAYSDTIIIEFRAAN